MKSKICDENLNFSFYKIGIFLLCFKKMDYIDKSRHVKKRHVKVSMSVSLATLTLLGVISPPPFCWVL